LGKKCCVTGYTRYVGGGYEMNQRERKFHEDMRGIYLTAKKELKYNASRFWQLVSEKGALCAAKILIAKDGGTYGFEILWEHGRLDLSIEAHVLKSEYRDLFTDEERQICRDRLISFGFDIESILFD